MKTKSIHPSIIYTVIYPHIIDINHPGAVSLKFSGGELARKLVYFVLKKKFLSLCETVPWIYQAFNCYIAFFSRI